jgi:CRISPR system Cascade subunit CasC
MSNGFIQLHFLTSYPASLLNRDDAGFAKRIPFGPAPRTRISSQCLKRHWRTAEGAYALNNIDGAAMAVRSRQTFERFIFRPLVEEHQIDERLAREVTEAIIANVLGMSTRRSQERRKKEAEAVAELQTNQLTVMGRPELDYLLAEARQLCAAAGDGSKVDDLLKRHFTAEKRDNLRQLRLGAGLDAALFGRMITADVLARCDAAIHVAHAFTVHAEASETDYFTAVDDLLREDDEGELGSAHINSAELTSGLYYGYVAVDSRLLHKNLSEDRALAAEVMRRLVHLIATVSPGAKLGSTAPHAYAHLMLAEVSSAQPRTLANAFLTPVRPAPDPLANTYVALATHLADLDRAYGRTQRRALALGPGERLAPALEAAELCASLGDLSAWVAAQAGDFQC